MGDKTLSQCESEIFKLLDGHDSYGDRAAGAHMREYVEKSKARVVELEAALRDMVAHERTSNIRQRMLSESRECQRACDALERGGR